MCHPDAVEKPVPGVVRRDVGVSLESGEELPGSYCVADGRQPGPGVLVIPDIYGRTAFYEHLAQRLAADGYAVLLPDYFFRLGRLEEVTREAAFARWDRLDENAALSELESAVAWLRERPDVVGARVGLLGFCLGGTLALDLCARQDDLVTVCYYAFPVSRSGPNRAPRPIDIAGSIRGPILAFWGDADYIDLGEVRAFSGAMRSHGAAYSEVIYHGAGHGFLKGLVETGTESAAAHDSWRRTLEFYAASLVTAGELL